ncbi:MAG: hypothetical protein SF187_26705 [Deltaproteobacteria bacterium]|nr:hypothetical protein [Deltaproteobacteria bacterium]
MTRAKLSPRLCSICAAAFLAPLFAASQPTTAHAAPAKEKPAATPGAAEEQGDASKVKVERGKGGKKVYRITEEIRIEGKIQKPEAFYVLQKSSINYDWQDLKQDFLPKILDSVTRAPF